MILQEIRKSLFAFLLICRNAAEVNIDLRQHIFPLIAPNSPIQYGDCNNIFLKESPKKKHSLKGRCMALCSGSEFYTHDKQQRFGRGRGELLPFGNQRPDIYVKHNA